MRQEKSAQQGRFEKKILLKEVTEKWGDQNAGVSFRSPTAQGRYALGFQKLRLHIQRITVPLRTHETAPAFPRLTVLRALPYPVPSGPAPKQSSTHPY